MQRFYPLLLVLSAMSCQEAGLSKSELDAIELNQENYRTAWLQNDSSLVMNTLSRDVILHPPGPASKKVVGRRAVKGFWFPAGDTAYIIRKFEISDREITGSGSYAALYGVSTLSWDTVSKDSVLASSTSKSEFVSLMRKEDGAWRIYRQMWNVKE